MNRPLWNTQNDLAEKDGELRPENPGQVLVNTQ